MSEFDWLEFLRFAERFVTDEADEATLRTCVSRAYYAAYHSAAWQVQQHRTLPQRDTHLFVWRWLAEHDAKDMRNAGRIGSLMRRSRIDADYKSSVPCTTSEARTAIDRARATIAVLSVPRV